MSDFTKEEKEFLNALNSKAALPDPAFKKALKTEVYKEYYKKPSLIPTFSFYFGALAALSLALIFIANTFFSTPTPSVVTLNTTFSTEEKSNVFSNILKNNPIKVVQASVKSNSVTTKDKSNNEISTIQSKYTENYYLAEYSTLTQSFDNTCTSLEVSNGTTFFSEFRDKNRYFSKIVTRDLNNQLVDYNLTKVKGINIEEYTLNNSGEVVRAISKLSPQIEVTPSYPVSYIKEANEESMFEDTILDQKIIKNGKEYYVLKSQRLVDCGNVASFPTSYLSEKSKVITLSYFNAVSFNLELTESYLNDISNSNLLYTQTFLKREKQVDLSKIEREFEFDLNLTLEQQIVAPVSYTSL